MQVENEHQLSPLIRVIAEGAEFSPKAHGPGYLLIYDTREKELSSRPSVLDRVFGGRERFVKYFVKKQDKPLTVRDWAFQWASAANDIDLDFVGSFEIDFDDEEVARRLVKALHRTEGPDKALHAMIDRYLRNYVDGTFRAPKDGPSDLLTALSDPDHKARANTELDKAVSDAVSRALGGAHFSIGFKLNKLPPGQLKIDNHPTSFTVPDVAGERQVQTTAQLVLNNYQSFRRSGLKDSDAVLALVKKYIDDAVQEFIFGKPYYDIVSGFDSDIKPKIEHFIREHAGKIGYGIRLIQTHPNIDALCLVHGFRVDLKSGEHQFRPRYSTGYVRLDISIEVKAKAGQYDKVARLIGPGKTQSEIKTILVEKLKQICTDEIQRIDRKQFNLAFDEVLDKSLAGTLPVVDILRNALVDGLEERHGLGVTIINISQAQTEEGERFTYLCGRTTPFTLKITAQAEGGEGEVVEILGKFEIIGIEPQSWDRFESKDFGYRKQSIVRTEARLALDEKIRQGLSLTAEEFEERRKALAIDDELKEIGGRISSVLTDIFSKEPRVADRSRTEIGINSMQDKGQALATYCIKDEFGLIIVFREFRRTDTLQEQVQTGLLNLSYQEHLDRAKSNIDKSSEIADTAHEEKIKFLGALHKARTENLADEDIENIEEKIKGIVADNAWEALSPKALKSALKKKQSEPLPPFKLENHGLHGKHQAGADDDAAGGVD